MNRIFVIFLPVFIYCQNVEMYLSLIYEGRTEGLESKINEILSKHPNDPGVIYLKALITTDGSKALELYNSIIEKFPSSKFAVESSVKIGEFLYSKGLYSQAAQQLRLIPRSFPRYPNIEKVVNLMSASFIAIGAEDSLKYYLGIYQSMFPNIIFQDYEISKKKRNISLDQKLPLESKLIKPYVIQIGAFGNIQNAKRLKLQVAQIGYDVNIVPIETNGRTFNAVRVVSYKSKSQAEKVGKVIKTKLGVEYRVLYRPKK